MRFIAVMSTTAAPSQLDPLVVMMLTALIIGIGVIFILHTRARIARRNDRYGSAREQIDAVKQRAEAGIDTSRATAEMLDIARRLASQLDNKAERLEQLLNEADERIAALGGAGGAGGAARRGRLDGVDDADLPPTLADERPEHLRRPAGAGRANGDEESLHHEIHRLADQGFTPVEIAKRLDEQTGKVELVLALRSGRGGV